MKRNTLTYGMLASAIAAFSCSAIASSDVTFTDKGGNDVVTMNKLINKTLAKDFSDNNLNVSYSPVEADYPTYIINALSAGTAPDAFFVDVFQSYTLAKSGKVKPNEGKLAELQKDIIPSLNEAFTVDGVQYGVPRDFNTLALQYNKDIFDDAGVDYPTNDDSWDDLLVKLKAVKAELGDEVSGICLVPDYARFGPIAMSTGWVPFNDQGKTVLDDNFKRAFEYYTGLKEEGVAILATDIGQGWMGGCFATEEMAVNLEGYWVSAYLRDAAPSLQYGSTMLPIDGKTGQRANLLFAAAWGINADGNVPAAEKAVELMLSEKAQMSVLESGLALPSRKALNREDLFTGSPQEVELAKTVFESANTGIILPYSFRNYGAAWMDPINEALSAVMLGQSTVEQAIATAQAKYDDMVNN